MPTKDLYDLPFDEATLAKLGIFEDYVQAWVPTFVKSNHLELRIFDFFAGQVFDRDGTPGSAIRILQKLEEFADLIHQERATVRLFFNEFKRSKFDALKSSCAEFIERNPKLKQIVQIEFKNDDFEKLFPNWLSEIGPKPSLVFLDQNGIIAISPKYLGALATKLHTDLLFFVSSSYFVRFGDREAFRTLLEIDMNEVRRSSYQNIHRKVIDHLRTNLPPTSQMTLYPFTIKKGSNIHGLVFAASHPRAVDKFLSIAWKRNPINGEANFDIDDDEGKRQKFLFVEANTLTKLERFNQQFRRLVLEGEITDNKAALDFAYSQGHLPKHAADVLRNMRKAGEVIFEGNSPLVTYEKVYKRDAKRRIEYRVINHGE